MRLFLADVTARLEGWIGLAARNVLDLLFGPELAQCAEPVFHVERLGNLAVSDGLNIDCHDS